MSNGPIPRLTKREVEERVLRFDVSGKMRNDENMVNDFISVEAAHHYDPVENTEDLEVSIYADDPIDGTTILQFNCSGGTQGAQYLLSFRFSTPIEGVLESLLYVEVY